MRYVESTSGTSEVELCEYEKIKKVRTNKKSKISVRKTDFSIIWKNTQSLRSRVRQAEFSAWMVESEVDIIGVCETWLKGDEYVEVKKDFT